jgi:hypothetical protein
MYAKPLYMKKTFFFARNFDNVTHVFSFQFQFFIRDFEIWTGTDSSLDETGPMYFPFTKTDDFCEHSSVPTIYSRMKN